MRKEERYNKKVAEYERQRILKEKKIKADDAEAKKQGMTYGEYMGNLYLKDQWAGGHPADKMSGIV